MSDVRYYDLYGKRYMRIGDSSYKRSYNDGKLDCESLNGTLPSIRNKKDFEMVNLMARGTYGHIMISV